MNKKTERKSVSAKDESREICRIAGLAFLLNIFLAVVKIFLAVFSGSLAITASAIDSGTDAIASLVIYSGVKLSTKKTKSFPMGLYKLENVASVVIALFIFIAGYEILQGIVSPSEHLPRISVSYIILIFGATLATFLFGQYAMASGRRTGSPTLIAEGRHRQVDTLSSIVVLVSIILAYFEFELSLSGVTIDQIGASLILIFIARTGWELLSDGMRVLLDASIDFTTLDRIRGIIKNEPEVKEVKSVIGRSAGRFRFIQAVITVKTENLSRAHQIIEAIEMRIRSEVANVERVFIHYEPHQRSHDNIALPLENKAGRISMHFGEAPYFAISCISRKDLTIDKQDIVENPYRLVKTAKGIRVAEWLVDQGVDHVGMKDDISHRGPGYVFSNGGVRIHIVSSKQIDPAINEIIHLTQRL
ncbi:MAG: cation diffusion facilitator family transporter [Desulfobacteraceae bacterium]